MTDSPNATMISKAMATATWTRASGATQGTPKNASQTKKSRLSSATRVVRSQGTTTHNMHKQCPIHPKSRHTLFECVTIRKSLNAPPLPQAVKQKDQEDHEEGDKSGAQGF
jgi:hypothetical protein